jgi:hypothetical protein
MARLPAIPFLDAGSGREAISFRRRVEKTGGRFGSGSWNLWLDPDRGVMQMARFKKSRPG